VAEKKWYESMVPEDALSKSEIDTGVPHIARVYDYWLGGKDNFSADRKVGDETMAAWPAIPQGVRGVRAFLGRVVRYLAEEAGIRQFLDIGTGIPAASNTHEVAQSLIPDARVVYVDNDPIVLAHARALLVGTTALTDYIDADARDMRKIVGKAARTLDFSQPVAVMMISLLHLIPDEDDPARVVAEVLEAVPSGSYLALSHMASDIVPERTSDIRERLNRALPEQHTFRTRDQVCALFTGLDLVEPGIVRIPEWRPESPQDTSNPAPQWGGVARKPLSPRDDSDNGAKQ
jgi:SAM-dependent methyltransferase